jgi:hypothetical protein
MTVDAEDEDPCSPDPDSSAIRRSSSLAGSLISAVVLISHSPESVLLVVGNPALRRIDTRLSARSPGWKVGGAEPAYQERVPAGLPG